MGDWAPWIFWWHITDTGGDWLDVAVVHVEVSVLAVSSCVELKGIQSFIQFCSKLVATDAVFTALVVPIQQTFS